MKYAIILCVALAIPGISIADNWSWPWTRAVVPAPELSNADANNGSLGANPNRRRVAGSALILEANGQISEDSIPSNAIDGPINTDDPKNKIFDGTVEQQTIPEPKVEKQFIVKPAM